jgi:hypothetical protein
VTTAHNHSGLAEPTATAGRGITTRIRAVAGRLIGRVHAAGDDRARARGWQVTPTPGPLGLTGRSYRDPRFDARRQDPQDTPASRDERHG